MIFLIQKGQPTKAQLDAFVILVDSVLTVQQALKAPSLDPTLKISDALFSLRQLVLTGGLQPTPEHELLALRGEKS